MQNEGVTSEIRNVTVPLRLQMCCTMEVECILMGKGRVIYHFINVVIVITNTVAYIHTSVNALKSLTFLIWTLDP